MADEALVVVLVSLGFIGLLPLIFFRRDGSFNLRWWFTGFPFFWSFFALLAGRGGVFAAVEALAPPAAIPALLGMLAFGGTCWTLGSHRVPLALWHQDNDAPASIVTWGPYKYVRHPFYTSFLLTQTAVVLLFPHALTLATFVYSLGALSLTARREERRLLESAFGEEYRRYMEKTGRLFPLLGRLPRLGRVAA